MKLKYIRLNKKFNLNMLIVYPNIICSTKKIYKNNKKFTIANTQSKIFTKNKHKLMYHLINETNDLEEAVLNSYPKVGKLIDFLKIQKGCYFSRITGS